MTKHVVRLSQGLRDSRSIWAVILLLFGSGWFILFPHPVSADGPVGSGTPGSCTEAALRAAAVNGGTVTFNCGAASHTITLTGPITLTNSLLGAPTTTLTLDGGSLITLDGGNTTRLFAIEDNKSLDLQNITLSGGNAGTENGGAIWAKSGTSLMVTNSIIENNTSAASGTTQEGGGGIFMDGNVTTLIKNSAIISNTAPSGEGGGILMANGSSASLTLVNTTMAFNATNSSGNSDGAAILTLQGTVNLVNATIVENSASNSTGGEGGGIWAQTAVTVNARNAIIAANNGGDSGGQVNCDIRGTLNEFGANFDDDDSCGNFTFNTNVSLFLGPLTNNGGDTPTVALLQGVPGNPAIDAVPAGQCVDESGLSLLAIDQRFANRPSNSLCDSGAFELVQEPDVTLSGQVSVIEGTAGSTTASYTATLSAVHTRPVTLTYATSDGSAQSPADFTPIAAGQAVIPAGNLSETFTIDIIPDSMYELDETFTVTLTAAQNALIDTGNNAVETTINDDDPLPAISIDDGSADEGDPVSFAVRLSNPSAFAVTAVYSTVDGSAQAGMDYTGASGSITFTSGITLQTVIIDTLEDALDEEDETFSVDLSSPVNATLADAQGGGAILDDDATPTVSLEPGPTVAEGAGPAVFTATLGAVSGRDVSVTYATIDNTATAGSDYTLSSGILTINAGDLSQSIAVLVVEDTVLEGSEAFTLALTAPVTNATIDVAESAGTIIDNDIGGVIVSPTTLTISEPNGSDFFTISLTDMPTETVTVSLNTSNGQCSLGSTVVSLDSGNWNNGQSVTVTAVDDSLVDGPQTCLIQTSDAASNDPNFQGAPVPDVTVTVQDDDTSGVFIYLPLVTRNYPPLGGSPDLVARSVQATSNNVIVVIENVGSAAAQGNFWVDVYIDPLSPPTLNAPWQTLSTEGLAWAVDATISPGQQLTLSIGSLYYRPDESAFTGLTPGTPVWAMVDSVNFSTTYGNILEGDETNNLAGPVSSTAAVSVVPKTAVEKSPTSLGLFPPRR